MKKIPLILLIISLIWTILLYIIPASLPPGTVTHLNGKANSVDYNELWEELPLIHRIVYTIGDLNCHQKFERSFLINGNQMPVCSRDVGVFLGINIGIAFVFLVNTKLTPSRAFLNFFINEQKIELIKNRRLWVILILFLSALPILIDGFAQGLTSYESTNPIRLLTGFVFGLMFSYATVVLMSAVARE